jgi:catalase
MAQLHRHCDIIIFLTEIHKTITINFLLKRAVKRQQGVCIESVYFRYNSSNEDNFGQATMFWNTLTAGQRRNLEINIAEDLKMVAPFLQVSETTT